MNKHLVKEITIPDDKRILVVGDLHGCYDSFVNKLQELNYNQSTDVIISVGDLVDRGSQPLECIDLLDWNNFYAVRGNHEQFCIDGFKEYRTEFYHKMKNNGGAWFYQLPREDQAAITDLFEELPILLEVKYKGMKFGFVHADVPCQDWEALKEYVIEDDINPYTGYKYSQSCIWSRETIRNNKHIQVAQVDYIFVGHTVIPEIRQLGNIFFIDTGEVFKQYDELYHLTVLDLKEFV